MPTSESSEADASRISSDLTRLLGLVAVVGSIFVAGDLVLRSWFSSARIAEQIVDIQSPTILYTKLDALRNFDGIKVALIGDSLVYGRAMEQHGDRAWRDHTIDRILHAHISEAHPEQDVMVMNLGMNGALPTDLNRLSRMVVDAGVDVIALDVTLRSFSADFSAEDTRMSRPWLHRMSIAPGGRLESEGRESEFDDLIATSASRYWFLYRIRDFLQWRLLDGEPRQAMARFKARLNHILGGPDAAVTPPADAILMMKAKSRYAKVNFSPENPQVDAFTKMLAHLQQAQQHTIVFYATENPRVVRQLRALPSYRRSLAGLEETMASTDPNIEYLGYDQAAQAAHFLDHVHVDFDGYQALAERMWRRLDPWLN